MFISNLKLKKFYKNYTSMNKFGKIKLFQALNQNIEIEPVASVEYRIRNLFSFY